MILYPLPPLKARGNVFSLCRKDDFYFHEKIKDGRYQKKVILSDGWQKLVYGRTIAEVNQAADALRDQDKQGLVVGDTTTVDEWAKTWFATYKSNLRANTQAMYKNAYNVTHPAVSSHSEAPGRAPGAYPAGNEGSY